jgi:hypothetical protein
MLISMRQLVQMSNLVVRSMRSSDPHGAMEEGLHQISDRSSWCCSHALAQRTEAPQNQRNVAEHMQKVAKEKRKGIKSIDHVQCIESLLRLLHNLQSGLDGFIPKKPLKPGSDELSPELADLGFAQRPTVFLLADRERIGKVATYNMLYNSISPVRGHDRSEVCHDVWNCHKRALESTGEFSEQLC